MTLLRPTAARAGLSTRARFRSDPPDARVLSRLHECVARRSRRRAPHAELRVDTLSRSISARRSDVGIWRDRTVRVRRRGEPPLYGFGGSREPTAPPPFGRRSQGVLVTPRTVAELPTASQTSGAPEIAIVGRSNVGKSTLLNALLGGPRVTPARRAATSARPGETRSLAFHRLGPGHTPDLILVDMPGYGFAFEPRDDDVSTGAGARAGWLATALAYLRWRGGRGGVATPDAGTASAAGLRRILLLVDARHGLKRADRVFLDALHARDALGEASSAPMRAALDAAGASQRLPGWDAARKISVARARARGMGDVTDAGDVDGPQLLLGDLARDAPARPLVPPIQVVLTKGDLVPREDIARRAARVRDELRTIRGARTPDGLSILPVAALRGKGLYALQRDLALLCSPGRKRRA